MTDEKIYSKNSIEIDGKVYYTGASDGYLRTMSAHVRKNTKRMFVNGEYIPQTHPLYKAGRYQSFDDAWSHVEIDSLSTAGQIYVIFNKAFPNWYKVGKAVSTEDRLKGYQTSSPFRDYQILYTVDVDNRHEAEMKAHHLLRKELHSHRCRGEWFNADLDMLIEVLDTVQSEQKQLDLFEEAV